MTGPQRPVVKRSLHIIVGLVAGALLYGLFAYVILPLAWSHYEHQKGLQNLAMVTVTAQGIPGDALNIGLVGSREDIAFAMQAIGWSPANQLTWRSSVAIVGSVILHRSYKEAPVSSLFLDNRREDLAYEKQEGRSAGKRHHVRLWQVLDNGAEGRPVWLGAVTFDIGVGLSHYTGQVTHRISGDIDAEREFLRSDLIKSGMVATTYRVSGVGPTLFGRNGQGNRYFTDGEIDVMVLTERGAASQQPAVNLPSPPVVSFKDELWRSLRAATGCVPSQTAC